MRQLAVYSNNRFAGVLTEKSPGKDYSFTYDSDYIQAGANPISVNFPLRKEAYESYDLFPFFINLLPEGANRKTVCRFYKIDENDYFGLLDFFAGKDIIGAVNLRKIQP